MGRNKEDGCSIHPLAPKENREEELAFSLLAVNTSI